MASPADTTLSVRTVDDVPLVVVVDRAGSIRWLSDGLVTPGEPSPVGRTLAAHLPELAAAVAPLLAAAVASRSPARAALSTPGWQGWSVEVVPSEVDHGDASGATVIVRHDPEDEVVMADRLVSSIARLVGHAVLNDLTIVRLFAETIGQALEAGDPVKGHVHRIAEVATHSSEMLHLASQLTRQMGTVRTVDVAAMLAELVTLLRAVAAPADVVVDLPDGPMRYWLDPTHVRREIVSMVATARERLKGDGRIYVSLSYADGGVVVVSSTAGARLVLPLGGGGTSLTGSVMVVQEDPEQARFIGDTLAAAGHVVHVVGPLEALDHDAVENGDVGLLITDLDLPGTSGLELARLVQQRTPRIVVLVVAGVHDGLLVDHDVLVRPFAAGELIERVDRLLR